MLGPYWLKSKAVAEACLMWRWAEKWNLVSVALCHQPVNFIYDTGTL